MTLVHVATCGLLEVRLVMKKLTILQPQSHYTNWFLEGRKTCLAMEEC